MKSIDLMYAIPILLSLTSMLSLVIMRYFRKDTETNFEREMKKLRQSLLQGKLDKKSFLYIRDNLKIEDLFSDETQRLDKMLEEKSIDSETYGRMKKILEMTFNEKMEEVNSKYNYIDPDLSTKNNNIRFYSH